jgi:hypothetical protein
VCNENGIGLYLKLDHFKFFVKMIWIEDFKILKKFGPKTKLRVPFKTQKRVRVGTKGSFFKEPNNIS